MAVDFEAAFDTVSWEFLTEALHCYNYGPYCIQMLNTFYLNSNNFSRTILDGFLGPKISMGRGIRQGDPISGYLFNLIMEPLTNQILQTKNINGIRVTLESEVRLSQYADDLIIFSRVEQDSVKAALHELLWTSNRVGRDFFAITFEYVASQERNFGNGHFRPRANFLLLRFFNVK